MSDCPSCGMPFRLIVLSDADLQFCENCSALWIRKDETVCDSILLADISLDPNQVSKCPDCGNRQFSREKYRDAFASQCDNCEGTLAKLSVQSASQFHLSSPDAPETVRPSERDATRHSLLRLIGELFEVLTHLK
jgi:predicted nucleic acid-binding Zn ribbon protein